MADPLHPGVGEGRLGCAVILRSEQMLRRPQVVAGFTTRTLDGAPLDLGGAATPEAWARAVVAVGLPGAGVARARQVHGRALLWAEAPGVVGEADALATRVPGLLLAVRVADCVPVLLVGEGVVAVAHAGWRGLALGVLPATVAALGGGPLQAAIGPHIGLGAYEVGEEVVEGIVASGVPAEAFVDRRRGPRPHVDLGAAAAYQLRAAGVQAIETVGGCTATEADRYFSFRARQEPGRLAGLVGLR